MRAAPPLQVSLHRFGAWRWAVGAFGLLAMASLAAWSTASDPPPGALAFAAVALIAMAIVGSAATLLKVPARQLRWDGRSWRLGRAGAPADEASAGELRVVLDLGPWMLLAFAPAGRRRRRPIWLPVQRHGLETHWHALRCALSAPGAVSPADRPDPQ